jgi:hypothetical protein
MGEDEMTWEQYCLSKLDALQKMFPDKNIERPSTLTEKFQWLKIHDSTFLKAMCADKILLRKYSKLKLGKDICFPILSTYAHSSDIEWSKLPDKFVIKCNHGSGYNIIVTDKNSANRDKICKQLDTWLKIDYGDLSYELYYNLIDKKIFIEPYMCPTVGTSLNDYKFWCFNGIPKFFTINGDYGHGNFNHYDLHGNLLDISRLDFPANPNRIDKMPVSLPLMIDYCKTLARDFKFVRVDFYEINGIVYLGELTFIPGSGRMKYTNPKTDLQLGQLLTL